MSCALFPPGGYVLIVDGTSSGAYSFQLTCSDVFVGVDLRPTAIDASPLRGDCRTFDIAGLTRVAVTNLGDGIAAPPFDVVVFEDTLDGERQIVVAGTFAVARTGDRVLTRMVRPAIRICARGHCQLTDEAGK